MTKSLTKNNKGFTLVELLVVVAILGILAVVLVPQYIQYVERSRQAADYSTLQEIKHVAEIELALLEASATNPDTTIKVEKTEEGKITITADGTSATAINDAMGAGELKSENSVGTYTLTYSGNTVDWDTDSQDLLNALAAGKASGDEGGDS